MLYCQSDRKRKKPKQKENRFYDVCIEEVFKTKEIQNQRNDGK